MNPQKMMMEILRELERMNLQENQTGEPSTEPITEPTEVIPEPGEHGGEGATTTDETGGAASDDSGNVYQNYYDHLSETGFLTVPDDFEFDGTPEKLEEAFNVSEQRKWESLKQNLLAQIPEEGKPLLNYFIAGGRDINAYLDTYGELDLETVDVTNRSDQKKVLKEYYQKISRFSPEKADKMIDKLEALDALEEETADALKELEVYSQQAKQQLIQETERNRIAAEEAAREERANIQKAITSTKFIPDSRKNKVKAFLFNKISRSGDNTESTEYNRYLSSISANPEHVAQLGDILESTYDPKKGFDMSRFQQEGKTEATKTFRDSLESKLDPSTKMSGKGSPPKNNDISWEEVIKQMEQGSI